MVVLHFGTHRILGSSVTGFPVEIPAGEPPLLTQRPERYGEDHLEAEQEPPPDRVRHLNDKEMPYRNAASNYWADATYPQGTASWGPIPLRGHDHAQVLLALPWSPNPATSG